MKVGDKIVGKNGKRLLYCGSGFYPYAIVISTNPLVAVSEATDMRWDHLNEKDFEVIGEAPWWRVLYCKWKRGRE